MSVFVHKCDLTSPENFRDEARLCFYTVRLLIERISWYCRDQKRKDGSPERSYKREASPEP